MAEPAIRALRIDAFRGFNEPISLDLNASAVLLRGPNGTGKTSVFDALQWLLLGDIERLRAFRERRDTEHLVNRYRLPGPAVVEAEIAVNGGVAVARRSGNYTGSQLTFERRKQTLEGDDALQALTAALLPQGADDIGAVLLTSGMLQQDVMRSLLEAKPGERFAALSRLLRLEELEQFQNAVERASERATRRTADVRDEVQNARRERQRLEQEVAGLREEALQDKTIEPALAAFDAAVQAVLPSIHVPPDRPATPQAATLLAREAGTIRRRITDLTLELAQLDDEPAGPSVSSDQVRAAEESVAEARRALDQLRKQATDLDGKVGEVERSTHEFARLASLAIPLLGDTCPVCAQPIDPGEVESHLLERAGETAVLVGLREQREEARRAARRATERLQDSEAVLKRLRQAQQDAAHLRQRRKALADELLRAGQGQLVRLELSARGSTLPQAVGKDLIELEGAAERLAVALGSSGAAARLASVESALKVARDVEQERVGALERSSRAAADASTIVRATMAARVDVAENRYARLRPLVRDLFARLDAHRAFTELDLEPTLYGRAGTTVMATTRDTERDITASPALVYSSAQANVAALAYFVALAWGARDHALPFLMLDDPLQSMDDVNVLAFADLCRFLRTQRQLIVSAHERRFADLLERKLAPREDNHRTLVLDFSGWDRNGPDVMQRELPRARTDIADVFLRQRGGGAAVSS